MEFPNLSFTSELADSASPQFHLQAQALDNYVSGTADNSMDTPSPPPSILFLCCCSDFNHPFPALSFILCFFFLAFFLLTFKIYHCIPTFTSSLRPSLDWGLNVKLKQELCVCVRAPEKPPRTWGRRGSFSEPRTNLAFVSPRRGSGAAKRVRRRAELQ